MSRRNYGSLFCCGTVFGGLSWHGYENLSDENIIDKGSASVFHLMASAVIDELWIHWFLQMAKWQSPIFLSLLHLLADTSSGIFIYCLVVLKHGPCWTNRINTRVLPSIDFLTNDLTLATHRVTNEIFFSLQYC